MDRETPVGWSYRVAVEHGEPRILAADAKPDETCTLRIDSFQTGADLMLRCVTRPKER
jgi:hypothetical protein